MRGIALTGDPAQSNAYNGLDDRVSATNGSTTHTFIYDADGRVLGEYGTSAADVIAETIWLSPEVANDNQPFGGDDGVGGYAPLAVATRSGSSPALTWLHGNHLGVPIAFTDASGAPVSAPSYTLPGFPGQMKTLGDIYYNRYRDYDSSTGRYVQADPIGLEGGANPYLYAEANPLGFVDPDGRNPVIVGMAIGIGIELGIQAYKNHENGRDVLDWRCYDWAEVGKQGLYGAAFGGVGKWVGGWVKLSAGSMRWNNASRRIRRAEDLIGKDTDLHHWALPRKLGDGVGGWRDSIVNHPWNLNPLPRRFHQAIHRANPLATFLRGAPVSVRDAVRAGTAGAVVDLTHERVEP